MRPVLKQVLTLGVRGLSRNGVRPSTGESVDVLIVSGQSNARPPTFSAANVPAYLLVPDAGIKVWFGGAWVTLDNGTNNQDAIAAEVRWGPEAEFAYRWRIDNPTKTLYIVKLAVGDTFLAQQVGGNPDWSPASTGEYYDELVTLVTAAKAGLVALGKTPVIAAMIDARGENDSTVLADADAFAANYQAFFENLLTDGVIQATTKLLIGRVHNTATGWTHRVTVRAAQATVAALDATNRFIIDADGYPLQADNQHYTTAGEITFGNDNYQAYKGSLTGAWHPATTLSVKAWWDVSAPHSVFTDTAGTLPATGTDVVKRLEAQKGSAHTIEETLAPALLSDGGRNAIRFTRASVHRLTVNDAGFALRVTGTNVPYTLVALLKRGTPDVSVRPINFIRTGSAVNDAIQHVFGGTDTVNIQRIRANTTVLGAGAATEAVPADAWYVTTWVFSGTTGIHDVNGVEKTNGALTSAGAITITGIAFGAGFNDATDAWDGTTAFDGLLDSAILLDVGTATADVTAARAYLAAKRGITL